VSSHVGGVRVRSRQAIHVLVRVDCCRRSTVIKSTILPSISVARRCEIAKGTIQHNWSGESLVSKGQGDDGLIHPR